MRATLRSTVCPPRLCARSGGYGNPHYNPYNDPYHKHKKKKGFLGDFFDFD